MALLRTESYKKGIIYSSAFNVGGKALAFFQQWLIGYYFGTTSGTDIFFLTYNLVLYVSFFFLNMTTSVLIPEAIKLRNRENDDKSKAFLNTFVYIYGAVGLILVPLLNIDTAGLFSRISSFSHQVIADNLTLIRWATPLVLLNALTLLLTEIMASYKYFTIPNIVNAINSLLAVAFLCLFHNQLGFKAIVVGLLVGSTFNLIVLLAMMHRQLHWNFTAFAFTRIKSVLSSGLYSQLGYIVYLSALFVPQYFFTNFSQGSLTAMNYADKIASIPGIFLITQITNVMAIKYNNLVSLGNSQEVANVTRRLMIYVSGSLFIVAIITSLCSPWIVNILFGFTKFTPEALTLTANLLSLMILILPFSFAYNMLQKIFNSYKKQNLVLIIQTINYGAAMLLYYIFIPRYGELSFPIIRLIPYAATTLISIALLKHYCRQLPSRLIVTIFLAIASVTTLAILHTL